MKINARKVVLEILDDCDQGVYSNKLIQDMYKRTDLTDVDKSFISRIVYGVTEQKLYLDYVIRTFSSVRLKKIEPSILNILRMSGYQFIFMDKTPDSAVVNEAVKLAKKASHRHSGFVNGLLRNMMRDLDKVKLPDAKKETNKFLSVKYSHPEWMVVRFIELFGKEFAEDLLKANNQTPALSLRVNTLLINREDLMTKFKMNGIECKISDIVEDGITVTNGKQLTLNENAEFKAGHFTIQDESSMKVSEILAPSKEDRILDLCAAPGGKTTHMAQLMFNKGKIIACDISDKKLSLVKENIERLKIDNVELKLNDATVLNESFIDSFDKVLVDAPCSGLGIIRRKPDIKYHKTMVEIDQLTAIQDSILEKACQYVKVGGVLVYSTCTVEPKENRMRIDAFLKAHPEFEVMPIDESFDIQLYPNIHETDGFYCCRLKRK